MEGKGHTGRHSYTLTSNSNTFFLGGGVANKLQTNTFRMKRYEVNSSNSADQIYPVFGL